MIIQNNKSLRNLRLPLMVITLLITMALSLTSCGSEDEPAMLVGYYMDIKSEVTYKASEDDEEQGTMSNDDGIYVLYTTIMNMKAALREAYPANDYVGNDAAVIAALDQIYQNYKKMYSHLERQNICVVKLYRTKMDGTIVKGSRALKAYHFGALPAELF